MWYTGNRIKGSNPFVSATKIKCPFGHFIFVLKRDEGMHQSVNDTTVSVENEVFVGKMPTRTRMVNTQTNNYKTCKNGYV